MHKKDVPKCPRCKTQVDAAFDPTSPKEIVEPRAGDFGVCGECGAFLLYGKRRQVKLATFGDIEKAPGLTIERLAYFRHCVLRRKA